MFKLKCCVHFPPLLSWYTITDNQESLQPHVSHHKLDFFMNIYVKYLKAFQPLNRLKQQPHIRTNTHTEVFLSVTHEFHLFFK